MTCQNSATSILGPSGLRLSNAAVLQSRQTVKQNPGPQTTVSLLQGGLEEAVGECEGSGEPGGVETAEVGVEAETDRVGK